MALLVEDMREALPKEQDSLPSISGRCTTAVQNRPSRLNLSTRGRSLQTGHRATYLTSRKRHSSGIRNSIWGESDCGFSGSGFAGEGSGNGVDDAAGATTELAGDLLAAIIATVDR